MNKTIDVIKDLLITIFFVLAATIVGLAFRYWHFLDMNVVIIYILSVLLTSRFTKGYFYGLLATVLSFVLFNYFFTEPFYSLSIYDPTNIITIIIMTITATITSALTSKVKQAAAEAREKEAESNALYQLTNYLTDAESCEKIASVTVKTISTIFSCNAAFVFLDDNGIPNRNFVQQKANGELIHRELDNPVEFEKMLESLSSDHEEGIEFYDYPIYGRTMMLGVLRIPSEVALLLNKAQTRLLHSMIESVSLALDHFQSIQEQNRIKEETMKERYRGNLLRAISHDLRTPLSGIMGTSEMLMGMSDKDDPRYNLAKDIFDDADWLHSLVENILSLTKIQNGQMQMNIELEAVEEIIGGALKIMEKRLDNREISVKIPDKVMLVPMEARLITQVLVNLIDNANKHTPRDKEIAIEVSEDTVNNNAVFKVLDRGTGIPEKSIEHIFKMFYTVDNHELTSKRGVGIGLSICQSIVEAHGGKISVANRVDGGAEFTFTLPLTLEENINE